MTGVIYSRPGQPAPAARQNANMFMRPVALDGGPDGMLYQMSLGLLNTAISCLTEAGLPVPDRKIIYPGQIPADCELVGVLFNGWATTAYGRNTIEAGTMVTCSDYAWAATFSVVVVRCTPAVSKRNGPPTAESMHEAARIASRDAEAMTCVVASVGDHGGDVAILTGPPQGGYQTVELDITLPYGGGVLEF